MALTARWAKSNLFTEVLPQYPILTRVATAITDEIVSDCIHHICPLDQNFLHMNRSLALLATGILPRVK